MTNVNNSQSSGKSSEDELSRLSEELISRLAARGDLRTYGRGEILITEGEQSDSLYILIAGELKVFTRDTRKRELVYNVLRPGEFFGELFLDGGPRSASVKAVTTSICVVVGREEFRTFMKDYPEFAECLVMKLIGRVRHATHQLRSVAMEGVFERAVALLNELAVEQDGVRVVSPGLTQQEIADRIGATREMVNQIIRGLIRDGYVERGSDRKLVLVKKLPRHS